jgi:acyl carrier protein
MTRSVQEIQAWIVQRVSGLTGVAQEEIDVAEPYHRYGLDSIAVVVLAADLEAWLGLRFPHNPLQGHSTIASLAQFLAEQSARGEHQEPDAEARGESRSASG